ncbi:MAG TPA: 6-phosphogluconolactonase [Candidatus Limnocylindria bacterium]|nr:6-phosphogluconolactonase [Candidatus Limnocylindria bacterium]
MVENRVVVLPDAESVARESARRLVKGLREPLAARGEAHLALTGGSSAVALYRELGGSAQWRQALDWPRVHLWFGDDRFVPVDHPDSNAGLAYSMLLAAGARSGESGALGATAIDVASGTAPGLPVHAENVHPFTIDEALSESGAAELVAQRYAEALRELLPGGTNGLPAFDVVLLGVGGDGHLLSVFPGSAALEPDAPLVLAIPAPEHIEPHLPRVTLNPRLLEAAGLVLVMVSGGEKAGVLAEILQGDRDPRRLPAQLAVRDNAVWLLDEAAAGRLARG